MRDYDDIAIEIITAAKDQLEPGVFLKLQSSGLEDNAVWCVLRILEGDNVYGLSWGFSLDDYTPAPKDRQVVDYQFGVADAIDPRIIQDEHDTWIVMHAANVAYIVHRELQKVRMGL